MGLISERFEALRQRGEKALVLFVTAGDPSLEDLPEILDCLQEAGADLVEIGIPFSDPIADGPTIQASDQRALDRGITPRTILEAMGRCKLEIPYVLMGYYNTVLRRGLTQFAADITAAGASGTIVTDLTPEESDTWIENCRSKGLDTIFLAAPTSTDDRLDAVCSCSTGFIYAVSRTGVTGAAKAIPEEVSDLVARLKARSSLPVCVGFGIRTPEDVRSICQVADGAVVGSWLVELLAAEWQGGKGRAHVHDRIAAMKEATR